MEKKKKKKTDIFVMHEVETRITPTVIQLPVHSRQIETFNPKLQTDSS